MFFKHPVYTLYGLLLLGGLSYVQYSGPGSVGVNELKNVPKTIRDNPGAWRSHYGYNPRYMGGK